MSKFIQMAIQCNSTMVDGVTILEIPTVPFDGEQLDSLHQHIEGMFEFLTEEAIEKAISGLVEENSKHYILNQMYYYHAPRKTTERTRRDEAIARYNTQSIIDDDDYSDDVED